MRGAGSGSALVIPGRAPEGAGGAPPGLPRMRGARTHATPWVTTTHEIDVVHAHRYDPMGVHHGPFHNAHGGVQGQGHLQPKTHANCWNNTAPTPARSARTWYASLCETSCSSSSSMSAAIRPVALGRPLELRCVAFDARAGHVAHDRSPASFSAPAPPVLLHPRCRGPWAGPRAFLDVSASAGAPPAGFGALGRSGLGRACQEGLVSN